MGVRNGRIFHPGVFWGVRKWRILCFISANSPSGVGGRFFARGVRFFELPGAREGGSPGLEYFAYSDNVRVVYQSRAVLESERSDFCVSE